MSKPVVSRHESNHATEQNYIIGFGLSLITTCVSFVLVGTHALSNAGLITAISLLAITQFVAQLLFFLHLGREDKPRWKKMVFFFMLLIVVVVVAGSIWIMNNLDYHMMSGHQMHTEEGL